MKRRFTIGLLIILSTLNGFPAGGRYPAGGRSMAMGRASVVQTDFWALHNNQAGIAWLKGISAGLGFENRYLIKELGFEYLGMVFPTKAGTFGLMFNRFGNTQYNELKAGLCYARKFGKHFSAGVQIDYLRIHIADDYGNKNLVSAEIGLLYQADRHLSFGVQILNPAPVKITSHPEETLPTIICIGLSYRFSKEFMIALETEKDLENPLLFRIGAEYHFSGIAYARIGLSTSPMAFTFGAGLKFGKITLDVASEYHQALGFSPSGSLLYSFNTN
jgi:hypothetical protein